MPKKSSLHFMMAVMVLAASGIACSLFTGRSTPTQIPPTAPVVPSETAVEPTSTAVSVPTAASELQIKLTDAQMTEYLNKQLATQTNPVLTNPVVHAHDGIVEVNGQFTQGFISGNVRVILVPSVDAQGKPHLKIQSADFGGIPVPDSIVQNFSETIDQAMAERLDPAQTGYKVNSIQAFDGYILITAVPSA